MTRDCLTRDRLIQHYSTLAGENSLLWCDGGTSLNSARYLGTWARYPGCVPRGNRPVSLSAGYSEPSQPDVDVARRAKAMADPRSRDRLLALLHHQLTTPQSIMLCNPDEKAPCDWFLVHGTHVEHSGILGLQRDASSNWACRFICFGILC